MTYTESKTKGEKCTRLKVVYTITQSNKCLSLVELHHIDPIGRKQNTSDESVLLVHVAVEKGCRVSQNQVHFTLVFKSQNTAEWKTF